MKQKVNHLRNSEQRPVLPSGLGFKFTLPMSFIGQALLVSNCAGTGHCLWEGPWFQKGPTLGLIFCCCHLNILKNFVFEPVFYRLSPVGLWSTQMSRGAMPNECVFNSLLPYSQIAFSVILEHRILVVPKCTEGHQDSK